MKVAVVTQYYPPDPPSWIPAGVAQGLRDRGHEVRVVTTYPHYATGRIAPEFRQRWRDESFIDGIAVRRVPIIPSHSSNPIGRIANYMSFALSSRFARRFVRGCDVAYVYATPMTVAAAPARWARDIPFVLHVQDVWPESVTGSGMLPAKLNAIVDIPLNAWLGRVYRRAARTLAIAPRMGEMLVGRGVPRERLAVVPNWSRDADHLAPDERASDATQLRLIYAGNLGRMQDVGTVIAAMELLRDDKSIFLEIAGSGVDERELRRTVEESGLSQVTFVGRLGPDKMAEKYAAADFQLVTLRDLPIFRGTIPSKLPAGLARGLPVISTVEGDVAELVQEHGLGFVARPEDPSGLAEAIRRAASTTETERAGLSRAARTFYDTHMSRQAGLDAIEAALLAAAEGATNE